VLNIHWERFDDAIPAFFGMVLIPLTYSITQGIIWGFLCWTLLKLAAGKGKELSWMLVVIDIFAIAALLLEK
jgi:AGZA family xanthine/uracil permease-like MFS transporter